jgi:hypothetical protein
MTSLPLGWLVELGLALAGAGMPTTDPLSALVLLAALASVASHRVVAVATRTVDGSPVRIVGAADHRGRRRTVWACDPTASAAAHRLSVVRT